MSSHSPALFVVTAVLAALSIGPTAVSGAPAGPLVYIELLSIQ